MTTITITEPTKIDEISITCTSAARTFISKQGVVLRVSLKQKGCSGFSYVFDVIEKPLDGDHLFPQEGGITLCVAPDAINVFKGDVILDYVKHGLNKRLEFVNPNEKNRCGCGESVQF